MSEAVLRQAVGRIRQMLARIVVGLVDDESKLQSHQVQSYGDVVRDKAEHFQHYGFTSVPFPGAEGIGLSLGGSTNHMVVINVDDRRYRLTGLKGGEAAVYDDLGQCVHLTREGIVVKGAGLPMVFQDTPSITFKADSFIRFETPRVEATQLFKSMQYQMGGVAGGVGALTATFGAGTMYWNGVNLIANGGALSHDGKNIGSTHTHGGIQVGGSNTAVPNP